MAGLVSRTPVQLYPIPSLVPRPGYKATPSLVQMQYILGLSRERGLEQFIGSVAVLMLVLWISMVMVTLSPV